MDVAEYAASVTTPPAEHLQKLEQETNDTQTSTQMLSGGHAGRFLELLVYAAQPKRVLEIGTYTGYSAMSMAESLPADGEIITLEADEERAEFARQHVDERVLVVTGPAKESIQELDGLFDLVFIDADKESYPDYFDAALAMLSPRGLIVMDNMLRGGRVLEDDQDEGTEALKALSRRLVEDETLVSVLVPLRDGITVVRRANPVA